jgi:UPF0042 nucleotide-binding protein
MTAPTQLIIVTGRSGSGKSQVLNTLEDNGFYTVDNLPASLIPDLVEKVNQNNDVFRGIAVGIDARNSRSELARFGGIVELLKAHGIRVRIIFLDASTEILMTRFSETRRRHPLSGDRQALRESLHEELALLDQLSTLADLRIDTSTTTVHDLRALVKEKVASSETETRLNLTLQSFGFKHGVPNDSDFVFDVRCLPNPHWDEKLRAYTGRDMQVVDFLKDEPMVKAMLEDISHLAERWIPEYEGENRAYFTISIGCTGGKHRSVYLAEALAKRLLKQHPNLVVRHRERHRWPTKPN